MTQILSTTYLLILLFFLILFSYYISNEILRNIQEGNIFSLPKTTKTNGEKKLDPLLHLNLAKIYTNKGITDAALYELYFLLLSEEHYYSDAVVSKLNGLLGKNLEVIKNYREAIQSYSKAIKLDQNNTIVAKNLARLTSNHNLPNDILNNSN